MTKYLSRTPIPLGSRPSPPSPGPHVGQVADAIANPRRRVVIDRLCVGPATTSELADVAGAALPTMQQHLAILRDARLIRSEKRGRTVTHVLDARPLEELEDWLATRRSFWTHQLGDLADALATGSDGESSDGAVTSSTEPA